MGHWLASPGEALAIEPDPSDAKKSSPEEQAKKWKEWIVKRGKGGGEPPAADDVGVRCGVNDGPDLDLLARAGWEPWRPCKEIPETLAKIDPEATALLALVKAESEKRSP